MASTPVLILIYLFQEYKITAVTCVPVKTVPSFLLIKTYKCTANLANLRQVYFKQIYKYGCHQVLYRKQMTQTQI